VSPRRSDQWKGHQFVVDVPVSCRVTGATPVSSDVSSWVGDADALDEPKKISNVPAMVARSAAMPRVDNGGPFCWSDLSVRFRSCGVRNDQSDTRESGRTLTLSVACSQTWCHRLLRNV
jgi:hypothetical protein